MKYKIPGIIICMLVPCFLAMVKASEPIGLDDTLVSRGISGAVDYYEDRDHALSIADIAGNNLLEWKTSGRNYFNFGYTESRYWFRFTTDNRTDKNLEWFLEVDFPPIDLIELYLPDGRGGFTVKKTGDTLPFSSRDVKYVNYLFRIRQEPGTMTCYMGISSMDSINFSLNILSYNAYLDRLHNDMPAYWIFFGLMAVFILYNLGSFVITREAGYLYLTCFIIAYTLVEFNIKGFASQYLWPHATQWTSRANPFLVSQIVFWITLFLSDFVGLGMPWQTSTITRKKVYSYLPFLVLVGSQLIAIFSLFVNVRLSLMLIYGLALCNITGASIAGIYLAYVRRPPSRQARIGNLAFSLYVIMAPVVILAMLGILPANFFTRWAMQIGTSFAVIFLSFGVADKMKTMKDAIQVGERRYRHLVESTSEIIFTLDHDNMIQSMNGAVESHLGFWPEDLAGTNFLDMIQETWNKPGIVRQMVLDYISDLKDKKKPGVQFRVAFKNKYSHEPKELTVTLEYTGDKGTGYAILGKASPIIDDVLLNFLETEEYSYSMNNYLNNAELMSQRLVRNLYRFANPYEVTEIRMALREAIINSIEHGNLNVTFDEKTGTTTGESYFRLIKERQMDSSLAGRKVRIRYSLDGEKVVYEITDEGEGFDYHSLLARDHGVQDNILLGHGRGLMMITDAFDRVDFNEAGNRVVLVKYFTARN